MKNGFSLIEVVISFAILSLVAWGVIFSFSSYSARKDLDSASARIVALVAEARSKTLAGESNSAWGIHFEETKAVLFKAPTYNPSGVDNKTEMIPRRVSISSINFQNNQVIFARLTGAANPSGSITLSVRGNASLSKTISVNALGTIESN
jgi:prepilin-type N-terminal cleavage/methylation domain-containing protein